MNSELSSDSFPTCSDLASRARRGDRPARSSITFFCIRCGEELVAEEIADRGSLKSSDFLCLRCRGEEYEVPVIRLELRRESYRCRGCSRDLTSEAMSDGRAHELRDICFYLCENCAAAERGEGAGLSIGHYTTLRKLGEGLGVVYLAVHDRSRRVAAVKLMKRNEDEVGRLNFLQEVAIITSIVHPGFVRFFEFGLADDESPFLVTEYVPGGNLLKFIDGDGNPVLHPIDASLLIAEALEALAYLHDEGYVHLDVKPENILCSERDGEVHVKIADFGLAANYSRRNSSVLNRSRGGTPGYMPREQLQNLASAHPTMDVYAAGATLYHLLTGYLPLDFIPPWQVRHAIRHDHYLEVIMSGGLSDPLDVTRHGQIVPLRQRRRDLPQALCRVVDKALEVDPRKRYPNARAFREALIGALA